MRRNRLFVLYQRHPVSANKMIFVLIDWVRYLLLKIKSSSNPQRLTDI